MKYLFGHILIYILLIICILLPIYKCQEESIKIVTKRSRVSAAVKNVLAMCPTGYTGYRCRCEDEDCSGAFLVTSGICVAWASQDQINAGSELGAELFCMKTNALSINKFISSGSSWDTTMTPAQCANQDDVSSRREMVSCTFNDGFLQAVANKAESKINHTANSCTPNFLGDCTDGTKCRVWSICIDPAELGIVFALDTTESIRTKENLEQEMEFVKHMLDFLADLRWFITLNVEAHAYAFDEKLSQGDSWNAYTKDFDSPVHWKKDADGWITNFEKNHVQKQPNLKTNLGKMVQEVRRISFEKRLGTKAAKVLFVISDFINVKPIPVVNDELELLKKEGWKVVAVSLNTAFIEERTFTSFSNASGLSVKLKDGLPNPTTLEELFLGLVVP